MSSLKKRATWGMVVGLFLLAAGFALFWIGRDLHDQALSEIVANSERSSSDDLAVHLLTATLPPVLGSVLFVIGLFTFTFSLVVWNLKPQPGSRLTLRGWKAPEDVSANDIATDKAAQAAFWGFLGTSPWIVSFCFGGFHTFLSHSSLAIKILMILIIECTVFYTLGVRLCRRRSSSATAAAPRTWMLALSLNYGGLIIFLGSISTIFFLRLRA